MTTTRILAHNSSGDEYAVHMDDNGRIVEAVGPLYYADVPDILSSDMWEDDPETAEWLNEEIDSHDEVIYSDITDRILEQIAEGTYPE